MDLKDAEKIEYDALRTRYNRLLIITSDKNCDLSGVSRAGIATFEEQKVIAEKVKQEMSKVPTKKQRR